MTDDAARGAVPVPIVDAHAARSLVAQLATEGTLALDTEGDGMFRYRTRLCTVQLAARGAVHVCDTLAFEPAPLFAELLGPRGPRKIVHDVSFDARVLFAHGIALGHVFDTSIAARFLGLKNTGLASLLAQWFQIELPKARQQADWGERPLDEGALAYLADDVRHLEALAALLAEELAQRDIAAEVDEECRYMLSEAQEPPRESSPFMRIKGVVLRPPLERARLYALSAERERIAQELDVPPTRLVTNDQLVALCGEVPVSPEALAARLPTRAQGHAACLFEAFERARDVADAPEEEVRRLTPRVPSTAELERKKRRRRMLTEFRAREAEARAVDLQVVLPGHCLNDLCDVEQLDVEALTNVPGFGACRVERYATKLVAELARGW